MPPRDGGFRLDRKYTDEQRVAIALAFGDHTTKEVVALAAAGKLVTPDGRPAAPFDVAESTLRTIVSRVRRRGVEDAAGRLDPQTSEQVLRGLRRKAHTLARKAKTPRETEAAARAVAEVVALEAKIAGAPTLQKRSSMARAILKTARGEPSGDLPADPGHDEPAVKVPPPAAPEPQPQLAEPEALAEALQARVAREAERRLRELMAPPAPKPRPAPRPVEQSGDVDHGSIVAQGLTPAERLALGIPPPRWDRRVRGLPHYGVAGS